MDFYFQSWHEVDHIWCFMEKVANYYGSDPAIEVSNEHIKLMTREWLEIGTRSRIKHRGKLLWDMVGGCIWDGKILKKLKFTRKNGRIVDAT